MSLFTEGAIYFATSYRQDEIDSLKEAKPQNILTAFPMWSTKAEDKSFKHDLINKIGYQPQNHLVDSGAFSFRHEDYGIDEMLEVYKEMREEDGFSFDQEDEDDLLGFAWWWFSEFQEDCYREDKNSFTLLEQYFNFLCVNKGYTACFALDKMGDNQVSKLSFRIFDALCFNVIPVYQATHITTDSEGNIIDVQANTRDFDILDYYATKSDYIGIGGTAISKVKGYTKRKRVEIIRNIIERHPGKKFHLLGSLDPYVLEMCDSLFSSDGQCWLAKTDKEIKVKKSVEYIQKKERWFDDKRNGIHPLF